MTTLGSSTKKVLLAGAAAAAMLAGSAGQASATTPGAGVFTGRELPPASEFTFMPTLCARFDPNLPDSGPLVHELDLTGTFHTGLPAGGMARFESNAVYFANPEGIHTDAMCLSPLGSVTGTLTITHPSFSCTGPATYTRRATSAYELQYSAPCNGTTVVFTGVQEPCPPGIGCPTDPEAGSLMQGDYAQIG